ncbi:hypothetical protein LWM68_40950 [Niabella sp. W65]|nr:hypothetical protein [Niabella sp. W65]MCH7368542.1 hypothetical protein [Niabella sp. W65]
MKKIELKPAGAFIIYTNDQEKIPGRFSMYVWDCFLEISGIENYMDMIESLEKGMSLKQYADLLALALNDYDRDNPKYTRASAMDFIDENFANGFNDKDFANLLIHAVGRVAIVDVPPALPDTLLNASNEPEKKKRERKI